MNIEQEFVKEIDQELSAEAIINKIRELRNMPDKWEVSVKLKAMAPDIARLSEADSLSVTSFAKQSLSLCADDIKSLKKEINKFSYHNLVKRHDMVLDLDVSTGKIRPTDKNLSTIFSTDKEICNSFKKNDFSNEIDVPQGGEWHIRDSKFPRNIKNDDLNQIKRYLINKYDVEYKIPQIDEAIHTLSVVNHYDPLLDYLEPLKWKGIHKAETWLIDHCGAVDNPYTRFVSKLVLVAAVARAYVPGIKYDHVVVLAGDQAVQKSTLIETLAGKQFFNEITLADNERDTIQKMQGSWIIELPEGMPFKRKEINEFKNFVTAKKNKERFAYERHVETYQRRSIFIMTINPTERGYLPDETGNRRFLPVRINGDINTAAIAENRDQLFAEAKHLFKQGFKIHIEKSDIDIMEGMLQEHEIAETQDDWHNAIVMWLSGRSGSSYVIPEHINGLDVWTSCFGGQSGIYKSQDQGARISKILRKLGLKYTSYRSDGIIMKGFKTGEICSKLKTSVVDEAQKIIEFDDF